MRNSAAGKMVSLSPLEFFSGQLMFMNPLHAPLRLLGLGRDDKPSALACVAADEYDQPGAGPPERLSARAAGAAGKGE